MREIKFRGFTKDEATPQKNKWVFGDFYRKGNNSLVGDEETIFFIRENNLYDRKIVSDSLGEYTGLKDKFGKEIYEGDIVEISDEDDLRCLERYANLDCMRRIIIEEKKLIGYCHELNCDYYEAEIYKYVFKVVFTREFKLENSKDYLSLCDYSKLCKIIGNAYENPELLEEQKWKS